VSLAIVTAVLLLTAEPAPLVPQSSPGGTSLAQSAASAGPQGSRVLDLPSIRRLFDALARQRLSADEGERVASWADLSLLAEAVLGDARTGPLVFDDPADAAASRPTPRVLVTPAVNARDGVAYQLLALGYSARETADVVGGRITKQALDAAQKMLLIGLGRDTAANYLDRQYKMAIRLRQPPGVRPELRGASPNRFDDAIEKYASLHHVDAAIVRAIIGVESAFDPGARSPAGAIGLMQLMPATARALGVDPSLPEQNIEGGVRYLSELLEIFGGIELALVAYNGGPGFARRYARGETALYGETRQYVNKVLALLRVSR
jgi:soluble lytic murein transglycosylase-like protein